MVSEANVGEGLSDAAAARDVVVRYIIQWPYRHAPHQCRYCCVVEVPTLHSQQRTPESYLGASGGGYCSAAGLARDVSKKVVAALQRSLGSSALVDLPPT